MKTALTIAGSDSSGGAGIQADIKTMTANGVYAMSAVTALTAQNTTGVYGILESTPEFLASQLDCIFTDIFPDAVKTGMVSSTGLIQVIADKLKQYQARNIVVEDTSAAILKMQKGAICVIEGTTSVYPGESTTFAIHGEKGSVIFDDHGIQRWSFIDEADAPQRPDDLGEAVGGAQSAKLVGCLGHAMLLRDLAYSVWEDRTPMIPPREARTAVKVICSIYESTRTGKEIYF